MSPTHPPLIPSHFPICPAPSVHLPEVSGLGVEVISVRTPVLPVSVPLLSWPVSTNAESDFGHVLSKTYRTNKSECGERERDKRETDSLARFGHFGVLIASRDDHRAKWSFGVAGKRVNCLKNGVRGKKKVCWRGVAFSGWASWRETPKVLVC